MTIGKGKVNNTRPTGSAQLAFRPLTPALMDALGEVLRGSWGSSCWCMYPRLTESQTRALPGDGPLGKRKRAAMTELAAQRRSPGLVAFIGEEPAGWVAIAPRSEFGRVARSRSTPPVDERDVWVIPCITVRNPYRGNGVAVELVRAALRFAAEQGAGIIEAYPRAGSERIGDDNAYFGTESLFVKAGFEVVRGPIANRPKNWLPRLAMRANVS